MWQVRPASVPLLPRLASKDGRASFGGLNAGLVGHPEVRCEMQTGVRERYLYIRPGQTYPLPQR
jgi:hypothetical protein